MSFLRTSGIPLTAVRCCWWGCWCWFRCWLAYYFPILHLSPSPFLTWFVLCEVVVGLRESRLCTETIPYRTFTRFKTLVEVVIPYSLLPYSLLIPYFLRIPYSLLPYSLFLTYSLFLASLFLTYSLFLISYLFLIPYFLILYRTFTMFKILVEVNIKYSFLIPYSLLIPYFLLPYRTFYI